jgi:hypothetical protein
MEVAWTLLSSQRGRFNWAAVLSTDTATSAKGASMKGMVRLLGYVALMGCLSPAAWAEDGSRSTVRSNPLTTTCLSCHGDRSSRVSCTNSAWLAHDGTRVSATIFDQVSLQLTGSTCSTPGSGSTSGSTTSYGEYGGDDRDSTGTSTGSGGSSGGSSGTSGYAVIGWNDLGMHCMDDDFSIFTTLPPYQTLWAQVVVKGAEPHLLTPSEAAAQGLSLRYSFPANTSQTFLGGPRVGQWKSNYYDYAALLFGSHPANLHVAPDGLGLTGLGLAGSMVPDAVHATMEYDPASHGFVSTGKTINAWVAEGIPLTPFQDDGSLEEYQLAQIDLVDGSGRVLASTTPVAPISSEMHCSNCHGNGGVGGFNNSRTTIRTPAGGSVDVPAAQEYRLNILQLHDQRFGRQYGGTIYDASFGLRRQRRGLYDLAVSGQPILCAACHESNGYPVTTGVALAREAGVRRPAQVPAYSNAIHGAHASVTNDCYQCHPGEATQCLRGAMVDNGAMWCTDCHGSMSDVAAKSAPWFDEPSCGTCHTGYPTNPNTPVDGTSLFRFSQGHNGVYCEACHGSTHAILPTRVANDNVQSISLQGEPGTLGTGGNCSACHTSQPSLSGGPHGTAGGSGGSAGSTGGGATGGSQDPLTTDCLTCHGDNSARVSCTNSKWLAHDGTRVSSAVFDQVTLTLTGGTCSTSSTGGSTSGTSTGGTSGSTGSTGQDPLTTTCLTCHGDRSSRVSCTNSKWLAHDGTRVSSEVFDQVSQQLTGSVCSTSGTGAAGSTSTTSGSGSTDNTSDPLTTTCLSCHGDRSSRVSCTNSAWLSHDGRRVSTAIFDQVTLQLTGATCP